MSTVTKTIPFDLLPVPEDQFKQEFNPQTQLKHKKSFVNKVFSKRHGSQSKRRKDDLADDKSESDSIRTMSSTSSGSIRSLMFSRKQRSNTMTSTASSSSFMSESGSVYSNSSVKSNASSSSECDKYGLPKDAWIPQYF